MFARPTERRDFLKLTGAGIAGSALDSGQALRWLRQLERYAAESRPT